MTRTRFCCGVFIYQLEIFQLVNLINCVKVNTKKLFHQVLLTLTSSLSSPPGRISKVTKEQRVLYVGEQLQLQFCTCAQNSQLPQHVRTKKRSSRILVLLLRHNSLFTQTSKKRQTFLTTPPPTVRPFYTSQLQTHFLDHVYQQQSHVLFVLLQDARLLNRAEHPL